MLQTANSPTDPQAVSMSDVDAEDLIARLSEGLDPHDRAAFRRAAESTVASSPECSGEGATYRVISNSAILFPSPDRHRRGDLGAAASGMT